MSGVEKGLERREKEGGVSRAAEDGASEKEGEDVEAEEARKLVMEGEKCKKVLKMAKVIPKCRACEGRFLNSWTDYSQPGSSWKLLNRKLLNYD